METKIATTQENLEKMFNIRYRVYVEEEQKFRGIELVENIPKDEFEDYPLIQLVY